MKKTIIILTIIFALGGCEILQDAKDAAIETGVAVAVQHAPDNEQPINYPFAGGGLAVAVAIEFLRRFIKKRRENK